MYVNGDMEVKLDGLREWLERKEEGVRTVFGWDFNAKIVGKGERIDGEEEEEKEIKRRSKDKKVNTERKMLVEYIKERGWFILNKGM